MDTSITYNSVSVHIDRINICKHFESRSSNKRAIVSTSEDSEVINVSTKKKIEFSTDGFMSAQTRRKMQKAIKYLNYMTIPKKVYNRFSSNNINMRLAFVTTTLPSTQIHSDNEIKSVIINQFLIEAKKKWNLNRYVWRSEKQRNGNVHFHFLFDTFVPYDELRTVWNRIVNKLGYVDKYKEKMSKLTFKQYEALFKENKTITQLQIRNAYRKGKQSNWCQPNSTDIHSLQFINDIDSYLFKYMSKSEQNEGLQGRMWSCSRDLSDIKGGRDIVDSELNEELCRLQSSGQIRFINDQYFTIMFVTIDMLVEYNCMRLYNLLRDYLFEHFNISKEYY